MPRQTHHDARCVSKLSAVRGWDRLDGVDGLMSRVGPIGRLGRYTATHFRVVLAARLLVAVVLSGRYAVEAEARRRSSRAVEFAHCCLAEARRAGRARWFAAL